MKISFTGSEQEFYYTTASRIADMIKQLPTAVIGLATGRTTTGVHEALCEIYRAAPFDTSKVTVFGMDEITNVSRSFPGSCYDMLLRQVVKPLHIPMENYLMPPTCSDDFAHECKAFESAIAERGGVDLQILGIGENGHLGFNQPGTPFDSTTWISRMDEKLDERIRRESGSSPDADLGGFTIGIKNIMMSRKIILAANGANKAEIVRKALRGKISPEVPASVLQLHPFTEVILDPAAASML
ncbi:MAG: glucosamine-6-phosphate deaminase [Clostridiales bacterium]|nr:glucosamine-6-phosphate deaminase [Clostridiales bacterium]